MSTGTDFKVIFHDTQVHVRIQAAAAGDSYPAFCALDKKRLLIQCSRGKQSGFYSLGEPSRHITIVSADLVSGLSVNSRTV